MKYSTILVLLLSVLCSSCLLTSACLDHTFNGREQHDHCSSIHSVHLDKDSTLIIQFFGYMQGDSLCKPYHLALGIDSLNYGAAAEVPDKYKRPDGKVYQFKQDEIYLEIKAKYLREGHIKVDSSAQKIADAAVLPAKFQFSHSASSAEFQKAPSPLLLASIDTSQRLVYIDKTSFRLISKTLREEIKIELAQKKKPFRFYLLPLLPLAFLLDIVLSPFYLIGLILLLTFFKQFK